MNRSSSTLGEDLDKHSPPIPDDRSGSERTLRDEDEGYCSSASGSPKGKESAELSGNDSEDSENVSKDEEEGKTPPTTNDKPYTVLSENEKIATILIASLVTFLGPISANMYLPALNPLSKELHVSSSEINLSITTYLIAQGLIPLLTGSHSDQKGRRPILMICMVVYVGSNIGLALQSSYPLLLCLRILQSFGSSGSAVVAFGTTADLVTRSERGKYMIYSTLGMTLGLSLGPVLGGILTQFLNWRSLFWLLVAFSGFIFTLVLVFQRETCRVLVGNGSIPSPTWNTPLLHHLSRKQPPTPDPSTIVVPKRRPSLLDSIKLALQKRNLPVILANTALYCGQTAILSSLPTLLERKYSFNALQTGLCFLPYSAGSLSARWTAGTLTDRNFRRHARLNGQSVLKNKQISLKGFPVERARLELGIPLVYISCVLMAIYGWIMNFRVHLAGPLIMLLFLGNALTGANNMLSVLMLDFNTTNPAAAIAATNFFRYLSAAGMAAAVVPLVEAVGSGWMGMVVAGLWLVMSPLLWMVLAWGRGWRDGLEDDEEEDNGGKS